MALISSTLHIVCCFNVLQTLSFQKLHCHWRPPGGARTRTGKNREDGMSLTVRDVTATSATVAWSPAPGRCRGGFYSVTYRPNWNSPLTGHAHRNFLRETAVPAGQGSAGLGDLSPRTTYVVCVSCLTGAPSRRGQPPGDRCQAFSTPEEAERGGGASGELAMGVWLASTVLLAVVAGALLCSCLRAWCRGDGDGDAKGPAHGAGGDPRPASFAGGPGRSAATPPLCIGVPKRVPPSSRPDPEEPSATP